MILTTAYLAMGAVVGYNAYQEIKRTRWIVDTGIAATKESLLTEKQLTALANTTFAGIIVFSVVAWPIVVGYDELEKARK